MNFNNQSPRILRKSLATDQFGISNSTFYARIKDGLIPPPISLGARAVGWLSTELDQVLAYVVAGKSDDEIRELVNQLVEQRKAVAA